MGEKLLFTDYDLLLQAFARNRKIRIEQKDGFAGLKAVLPPPPRRAVVLIDPPYEQKQDYARVVDALKDSLQRFATGTYILWYPLLQRPEPKLLQERLQDLNLPSWLHVTLSVQEPSREGYGMFGSGLFVINLSMLFAFLSWGLCMPRLVRRGWDALRLITLGVPLSLATLATVVALGERSAAPAWALWCVSCTFVTLAQPAVGQAFDRERAGRAQQLHRARCAEPFWSPGQRLGVARRRPAGCSSAVGRCHPPW